MCIIYVCMYAITYAMPVYYVICTATLQERRVFFTILRDVFVGVVDHTQLEELIQEIHPPPAALLSGLMDNPTPLSADVSVSSPITVPPALEGEGRRAQVMAAIAREAHQLGLLLHQPWMRAVAQVHTALSANHGEYRL